MDSYKQAVIENSLKVRSQRVKRIKAFIIGFVCFMAVVPTILCIILFVKVYALQNEVNNLKSGYIGATFYNDYDTLGSVGTITENSNSTLEEIDGTMYNSKDVNPKEVIREDTKEQIEESPTLFSKEEPKATEEEVDSETNESISAIMDESSTIVELDDKEDRNQVDLDESIDDKVSNTTNLSSNKQVYLTFDDGPSKYTSDLLDLLNEYNVKVTFFVIGKTDKHSLEMYKRIVDEGHALGIHSYSHDYTNIYKSLENFDKDFTKLRDLLYDTTGYLTNIYRFPGGSANSIAKEKISMFIEYLNEKNVTYFDWNVVNGDGTSEAITKKDSYLSVINGIKVHKRSIVLLHDTDLKQATIESVEDILKTLIEHGIEILPLDNSVKPIQQIKANTLQ